MLFALWIIGCQCASEPEQSPAPPPSHFGTFHGLVSAAVQGDVAAAQWIARSLQEGNVSGETGMEKVGGALGFIQLAEDPTEVADGLAAAAVGCGECHQAEGVPRPRMGSWTHENGGLRMVIAAAFPPLEAPPTEPEQLGAARLAWDSAQPSEGEDPTAVRLAAALTACTECHLQE